MEKDLDLDGNEKMDFEPKYSSDSTRPYLYESGGLPRSSIMKRFGDALPPAVSPPSVRARIPRLHDKFRMETPAGVFIEEVTIT